MSFIEDFTKLSYQILFTTDSIKPLPDDVEAVKKIFKTINYLDNFIHPSRLVKMARPPKEQTLRTEQALSSFFVEYSDCLTKQEVDALLDALTVLHLISFPESRLVSKE